MINRAKSRLLSSILPNIAAADQQQTNESQSRPKGKQQSTAIETIHDTNLDVRSYSNLLGDAKQIKRYINEILDRDRIIELRPDGTILITPHRHQQLPNEVVSMILTLLSKERQTLLECALVNKQFHAVANPLLSQVFGIAGDNIDRLLDCLPAQRLAMIRELYLTYLLRTNARMDTQLSRLLPHLGHLNHLSVHRGAGITDASFKHLPQHCQHLTSLELFRIGFTKASFAAIGQHCHRLSSFDWTLVGNQAPEWLEMLAQCPLQRLKIDATGIPLNEKAMTSIKQFNHLTSLSIISFGTKFLLEPTSTSTSSSNQSRHLYNNNNNNNATRPHWPLLTNLTLHSTTDMDDTMLIRFIKSHPHLQYLHLSFADLLTDTSLNAMANWLPGLVGVTLAGSISPYGVRRLVRQCQYLNKIDLRWCHGTRFTGESFPELLECTNIDWSSSELDRWAIDKIRQAGAFG